MVFDQERLDERRVLARLKSVVRATARRSGERRARSPAGGNSTPPANDVVVGHEATTNPAPRRRARVAVRGLDRDPELARRLVERLSRRPGVLRVSPSPLTGRVLVELTGGARAIQQILDDIADLELPAADDEEFPAHPLDPSGIIERGAKTIGAGLGLALLLGRRMAGSPAPPIPQGAGEVASTVGLIEGLPAATRRIEGTVGHERKELVFGATAIIAMSASGNPFGLAFAGAAALRLLTESLSRRRAWREYELRTREHPAVHPGAVVTLAPGQRAPLPGQVVDGFGVCMALDGSPQAVYPGARLDPGARIQGAAVTLELGQEQPFAPTSSRPPPGRDPLERYLRSISYGSLAYALATGLLTRSPARILTALLLVNPIPALAGRESADRGASARVIRAGAVVAGTRPRRPISCPETLLIDEPRTLCDGWELLSARSLADQWDEQQVLALACRGLHLRRLAVGHSSPDPAPAQCRRRNVRRPGCERGRCRRAMAARSRGPSGRNAIPLAGRRADAHAAPPARRDRGRRHHRPPAPQRRRQGPGRRVSNARCQDRADDSDGHPACHASRGAGRHPGVRDPCSPAGHVPPAKRDPGCNRRRQRPLGSCF